MNRRGAIAACLLSFIGEQISAQDESGKDNRPTTGQWVVGNLRLPGTALEIRLGEEDITKLIIFHGKDIITIDREELWKALQPEGGTKLV